MSAATQYPHLTIGDDGIARIAGSRYTVKTLAAEHFHYGWSGEEILRQHPDLRPEQVYSALTYFYDHAEEMIASIENAARTVEDHRAVQRLTRSELLRRRAADRR